MKHIRSKRYARKKLEADQHGFTKARASRPSSQPSVQKKSDGETRWAACNTGHIAKRTWDTGGASWKWMMVALLRAYPRRDAQGKYSPHVLRRVFSLCYCHWVHAFVSFKVKEQVNVQFLCEVCSTWEVPEYSATLCRFGPAFE